MFWWNSQIFSVISARDHLAITGMTDAKETNINMADIEIEPSVHMRLYSMNKRHFATIFLVFMIQIGILIVIGVAGPAINEQLRLNISDLNLSDINKQTGPFLMKTFPLSSFNQQLWMSLKYLVEKAEKSKFELSFTTIVSVQGFVDEQATEVPSKGQEIERTVDLTCSFGSCNDIPMIHLPYLLHPYYIINIRTMGLESIQFKITDIQFLLMTYSSSFTQLQIWFKFVFLILSFLATCSFAYSLRKFPMYNWSMEQRWMTLLLPLLILYNNPTFALTFLVSNWIPGTVDIFFQATFLGGLLLFWLSTYHGVRQVKRKFGLFYFPKILLVGALWFSVVFFSSWYRFRNLVDPTDVGDYLKFKVIFGILSVLYLLHLLFLVIRAFAELRSMPYFDLRLKFMTSLIIFLVVVTIIVIAVRPAPMFGVGFLPALSPYPTSTLEFVLLYGMVNIHIMCMAFVYSPSSNAFYESHFKDNPALSMLNDSEDEVIYGEEISLTSNKLTKNKYDSEEDAFN